MSIIVPASTYLRYILNPIVQDFAKKVIEGVLFKADPSGWGDTDSVKSPREP